MRIVFEFHGEVQVNREIMRTVGRASDCAPIFEEIFTYLLKVEKDQFDTEGAQSGHPWAPLAESTIRQKARAGLRPEILRATDDMRRSLTEPDAPNQLKVITPSVMAFGSFLPYAKMHQKPSGAAHYPQRRPIDLTEENKAAIVKAIQFWIMRGKVTSPLAATRAMKFGQRP